MLFALLFQTFAGLTLFLFVIHYFYYIINAIAGDWQEKEKSEPKLTANPTGIQETTTKNKFFATAPSNYNYNKMQTTDDAKFIKK